MQVTNADSVSPYEMSEPPTSPGRALLSRAFESFCTLHWGYDAEEIVAGFCGRDPSIASDLAWSSRLLGELLARGDIRSWARPFGGGEPMPLRPILWELDDFLSRFASSALDMQQPFDGRQSPTHWIFVDVGDWNRIVDELMGFSTEKPAPLPIRRPTTAANRVQGSLLQPPEARSDEFDRLVRLPEVIKRTGMSKPTIYRRISGGRFPRSLLLEGNIAVWREEEIAAWIADPS